MAASETYFSGTVAGGGGDAIYATDGTVAGTKKIVQLYGASNTPYGDFVRLGTKVMFTGEDSRFQTGLFFTEGTAATTYEILPAGGQNLDPSGLASVGGKSVVFNGLDSKDNYDLWVSNGTAAGTRIVAGTTNIDPRNMFSYKTEVLFTSINKKGLWTTNGVTAKEVAGTSALVAEDFTLAGTKVFFADAETGSIYSTDGTTANTRKLFSASNPIDLTAMGTKIVFEAEDKNGHYDLFLSNGTAAGTHEVAGTTGRFDTLQAPDQGGGSLSPDFTAFKGKILFEAVDAAGKFGLWTFDGVKATEITGIKGAFSQGIFSSPSDPDFNGPDFAVNGNEVVFDGISDGGLGAPDFGTTNLWVTDGTAAGTKALKSVAIDGYSSTLGLDPSNMTTLPASTSAAKPAASHAGETAGLTSALFDAAFAPSSGVAMPSAPIDAVVASLVVPHTGPAGHH